MSSRTIGHISITIFRISFKIWSGPEALLLFNFFVSSWSSWRIDRPHHKWSVPARWPIQWSSLLYCKQGHCIMPCPCSFVCEEYLHLTCSIESHMSTYCSPFWKLTMVLGTKHPCLQAQPPIPVTSRFFLTALAWLMALWLLQWDLYWRGILGT